MRLIPDTETTLIFIPNKNHTKRDYSAVFKPEAERFCDFWDIDKDECIHQFDISKKYKDRAEDVYNVIDNHRAPLNNLVFFCHGFPNGIQCGIKTKDLDRFVESIWQTPFGHTADEINVILYCCSTGDTPGTPAANERRDGPGMGDNSFADKFRDKLCEYGFTFCTVWGHTTVGHSTRNPYMRVFYGEGSPEGGSGGRFPVSPNSSLWKEWKKALWSRGEWKSSEYNRKNFRFAFPYLGFDGFAGPIHESLIDKQVIIT